MTRTSATLSDLIGKTLADVTGCTKGSKEILWTTTDGAQYRMFHDQDCCESVVVEDVTGNVADLLGSPITMADESSSERGDPAPPNPDSWTWTFYKLATVKGYVDIRWLGESNGYYGEEVSFVQTLPPVAP